MAVESLHKTKVKKILHIEVCLQGLGTVNNFVMLYLWLPRGETEVLQQNNDGDKWRQIEKHKKKKK